LQKTLDALQQKRLFSAPDIIRMLFFSIPSFGGFWPGPRTPAFLYPAGVIKAGNFPGVKVPITRATNPYF